MQTEAYLKQNAKGYEGDSFIGIEIKKLVDKFKIQKIIETGTYFGATTKRLAEFAPVLTIEINEEHYRESLRNIKGNNNAWPIISVKGNSVEALDVCLGEYKPYNVLFFLDAHWHDYCPLIDELILIAKYGLKPVIVIHDWKVPGRADLGFDSYKGQDFTWEWIQEAIENIYGVDGYAYHYNDQAEGAKRGVIYIYPKQL